MRTIPHRTFSKEFSWTKTILFLFPISQNFIVKSPICNKLALVRWWLVACLAKKGRSSFTTPHITMTSQWPRRRLKSPVSRLFTQSFIWAQIKENIKAPRHWSLCEEFTGTGEFPAQRASNAENVSIWWRHHDYGTMNDKAGISKLR